LTLYYLRETDIGGIMTNYNKWSKNLAWEY